MASNDPTPRATAGEPTARPCMCGHAESLHVKCTVLTGFWGCVECMREDRRCEFFAPASAPPEPRACQKAQHTDRGGYLHAADDDSPYDVDGVLYCGRCHHVCNSAGRCESRAAAPEARDEPSDAMTDERLAYLRDYLTRFHDPKVTECVAEVDRLRTELAALHRERETLHRMLETSTVRLGILRDRMEGCSTGSTARHPVSLAEIPAWIEEQEAVLAAHRTPPPVTETGA